MSKGPKLRDLSRHVPSYQDRGAIYLEFIKGPPLVAAILGASLIENQLDELLRSRFGDITQSRWDEMTSENGPFYTLHAKIIAAHGFRLFDDTTRDHLNRIRNIRNAFAHAKLVFDFSHPLVTKELRAAALPPRPHSGLAKDIRQVRSSKTAPRDAFRLLCEATYGKLMRRMIGYYRARGKNFDRAIRKRMVVNPFRVVGLAALGSAPPAYQGGLIGSSHPSRIGDPSQKALRLARAIAQAKPTKDED